MQTCHVTCCVVLASLLFCPGCETRPAAMPAVPPNTPPTDDRGLPALPPPEPARSPFVGDEGYWHSESAVGFLFPADWTNLGITNRGPITSLGLRKGEGDIEVTLYWSTPENEISDETIGDIEYSALKSIYGDKVGSPQPVAVGKKSGFRLPIDAGPLGQEKNDLKGVVYVFAVKSHNGSWKIKVRATATTPEQFAEIAKLLDNYRWPEF